MWTPDFWLSAVHPDDRARVASDAAAVLDSATGRTSRYRLVCRDGEVIWVESHRSAMKDWNGETVGTCGVTLDITDAMAASEAGDHERARFESIVAAINYGVFQIDEHANVVDMNPGAERLLGTGWIEVAG